MRISTLETEKQHLEQEVAQVQRNAAAEVERANASAAAAREEKAHLELDCETARNELQKTRSELAKVEDRCKRNEGACFTLSLIGF